MLQALTQLQLLPAEQLLGSQAQHLVLSRVALVLLAALLSNCRTLPLLRAISRRTYASTTVANTSQVVGALA